MILDGLDEVPQSANRSAVLRAINELWDEAANADLLMIVTTRPQGYNDDLDPSYYSKLEMTPLSSEQALTYAIKLAAARIADPIHSERVVERIKEAAKSKTTARLMVSPLQVAILLALIDQRGDAPTDRWSLFDKYFAVVLQREQGKTGPIGQTMRHWGRQISAIHYKAGFLLHVEAETQGNSEAYLSKIDLERLIRSQLLDEEFEGEELQRATTELLSASTERLVLLVQRAEDRFSFEVRSLQEFMAAAHLMTGREAVVQERLRTISNRTHWLHVFQIAASKCFSENDSEQYRDTIITLCREINESGDEVDRLLRTGSKLALALLDDGLAYDQPKYRRLLLSTAFDLLLAGPATLPDSLSNHCERDPDRTIENIRRYLSSTLREPSSAAWKLILICSSRNQLWVKNILTEIWPADSDQAARLFEHWIDSSTNPELHTRMRHVLECASPLHIKQALNSEAGIDLRRRTDTLTKNYPSLALLIYSDDEIFTIAVNIGDRKTPLSLRTSSIKITPQRSRAYGDLPKTPCWEPQRALRDFHENPNTSTLATLLNRIAHEDWLEIFEEMLSNLPWPLATLIKSGRNKNSLIQIAEEVSKGSYGDNLDWHAAEERWKSQGVCEADLDFVASGLFFDSNVKSIGAPWSTLSLIHREEDSSWVDQILTCALSSQDKPRWWLRRILQFVLPVYMLPREISLEEALLLVEEPQDLDQPEWIDPSFLAILPQALLNEHPLLLRLGKFGESGRVNIARNIAVPAEVYSSLATRINEIPGLIVVLINTFLGDRLGPSLDALGEIDTATIRKNPSPAISGYSKILSNFTESIDEMSIEEVLRLPYHNEISLPSYTLKRILEDERVSREQGEKISEIIARIFNRNPTLRHINFMHIIRTFADSRQAELHRPSSWNSLQLGKSLFELTKHHERPEGIN